MNTNINLSQIGETLIQSALPDNGKTKALVNDWAVTSCVTKSLFNKTLIQKPLRQYSPEEQDYIKHVKTKVISLYLLEYNNSYKIKSYYLAQRYKGHCIRYSNPKANDLDYILDADRNIIISSKSGRYFDVDFLNCSYLDSCDLIKII